MLGDKFPYPLSLYSGPHLDFKITTTIKFKKEKDGQRGKTNRPVDWKSIQSEIKDSTDGFVAEGRIREIKDILKLENEGIWSHFHD